MGLLSLEQNRGLLRVDFAFYALLVAALAVAVVATLPPGAAWQALAWTAAGVAAWTLAEYGLHRFVLHGLQPFRRWHALHHARPQALIATPTLLTAALFGGLVFAPVLWLAPLWQACAGLLGVAIGYLAYIATHHAVHHARGQGAWLRGHRHWHALHHRPGARACYGVSLRLWDRIFGSTCPHERAPAR